MTPTFTVLIGSKGRDTLKATLDSIGRQARIPGDQVIVCFDAYEADFAERQRRDQVVELFSRANTEGQFVALHYTGINRDPETKVFPPDYRWPDAPTGAPYHWLGVEQINHALRSYPITGSHLFTIGDDDVFVDGAYETLREFAAADQSRPILYRFLSPARDRLWDLPRMRGCLISGCCIAAPRQFVDLHPTEISTMHDYFWLEAILKEAALAGKSPLWLDYVGVIARPPQSYHRGVWTCKLCDHGFGGDGRWGFVEDGIPDVCGHCGSREVNDVPCVVRAAADEARN